MFRIFVNSWKTKEIRNKILYTLMIFAIVRLGTQIALPGIDTAGVMAARENASLAGTLYSVIAGGANSSWSLFAMGIGPYINASIIMQLLTIAIPKFEQLSKEGPDGRKKLQSYSRYLTVVLALIQGIGLTYTYQNMYLVHSPLVYIASVFCLVCGSTFVMWLAEQITAFLQNGGKKADERQSYNNADQGEYLRRYLYHLCDFPAAVPAADRELLPE